MPLSRHHIARTFFGLPSATENGITTKATTSASHLDAIISVSTCSSVDWWSRDTTNRASRLLRRSPSVQQQSRLWTDKKSQPPEPLPISGNLSACLKIAQRQRTRPKRYPPLRSATIV
ncbi:hypothetical protein DOTSEDRAFT_36932 [Dothistroma septosporum NZE10]|uniref:Uncharacterized protein n=1 Tax=Dothistroma septosporum (strain NZE10 / CBS 128990) TaxID=675120 RepID=N1PJ30_DOTSN|nr:hypothetical protein DOTSEDRAFT_36932 [Dothistroma septosporum NZE10]